MSYNGYLIKVGNYKIPPHKFIKAESYMAYKIIKDLDSYEDANGDLHRNALEHFSIKVEFETPPLTNVQLNELMSSIQNEYTIAGERKVNASVYIPETNSYVTQDVYMPDITPTIYGIFNGIIHYKPIRFAFIGYGGTE